MTTKVQNRADDARSQTAGGREAAMALVHDDLIARGKAEETAKVWGRTAADFEKVCGQKKRYTRSDVTKWLVALRERELGPNTIRKNMKAIHLLAQIQGWDFPKMSIKPPPEDEIRRPSLTQEQMKKLILETRKYGSRMELCILALGTVYGLRRVEFARLRPEDLVYEGMRGTKISDMPIRILVRTAKGGKVAMHDIPQEIRPFVIPIKRYSTAGLSLIFNRIAARAGLGLAPGNGWHSVRRSLATELVLADVSALNIIRFMRWSDATASHELGMLAIYAKKDQTRIDAEVFRRHPFLRYWQEEPLP